MLLFDTSIGTSTSNSYCTIAEANDYFSSRLHSEQWTAITEARQKQVALMSATRTLDTYIQWIGFKATQEQALDWPRIGAIDDDGYLIEATILPKNLKIACNELAYYLLENDVAAVDDLAQFKAIKLDVLALEMKDFTTATGIPSGIYKILGSLVASNSGSVYNRILTRC